MSDDDGEKRTCMETSVMYVSTVVVKPSSNHRLGVLLKHIVFSFIFFLD